MIDSGNFPACLRSSFRFQFPGNYNEEYKSSDGVVTFGAIYKNYVYAISTDSIVVGSSASQTITISTFAGGDPGFCVGWIIYLWAGLQTSPTHMLARVTAYDATDPFDVQMTFQAYQSKGTGTFSYWTIGPQFENAVNFIQNPNYSGFELRARYYADSGKGNFSWPYQVDVTPVVTVNTNVQKSGYTLQEYKAKVEVQEDEYDYNRPYVGKTATVTRVLTTEVTTTIWDYSTNPPTETSTSTSTTENVSQSHSFDAADFDPSAPEYVAGAPAVYSNGALVSPSSPGYMVTVTDKLGEYKSYEYDHFFRERPSGSGVYEPTLSVITVRTFGDAYYSPITPSDFFNGL